MIHESDRAPLNRNTALWCIYLFGLTSAEAQGSPLTVTVSVRHRTLLPEGGCWWGGGVLGFLLYLDVWLKFETTPLL